MTDDHDGKPETPSLERREERAGRLPGNRYVRIVRPSASEFRRGPGGIYIATGETVSAAHGPGRLYENVRRVLLGRRLESEADATERLSVFTGLAILGSDNISSSAYATEEAMRILALAGVGALSFTTPISIAIVFVLAVVVLSQLQVIQAYPNGGGSYIVTRLNLGELPGLVAASALLIDYVLTVAVSTAAGVLAITSFLPQLFDDRVLIGIAFVVLLALGNLRGVREAGILFAGPTYVYILSIGALILYGLLRVATGDIPVAIQPPERFPETGEAIGIFLILRAFASGSVALTGSEAISNGVPSMAPPEQRHAGITLLAMGTLFGTIFLGLTFLAQTIGVTPDRSEVETLNSLVTRSLVGTGWLYYLVQISTAILLALAANTGFTGFPRLASVLANDRYMPRQFAFRGDRLAFSTGIVALALLSILLIIAFEGSVTNLIPLYTIGVFLAFTLSQSGLIRKWRHERPPRWRARSAVNALGAVTTAVVLVVVLVTKFKFGAWMIVVTLPILVWLLYSIHRHYARVQDALVIEDLNEPLPPPASQMVIVPVARLDRAALQAIAFARSISPNVKAVHLTTSEESAREFKERWEHWAGNVPLDIIESPYRSLIQPLLHYIDAVVRAEGRPVTVVLAEFVPQHWWEFLLHSQTALRLRASLLFRPDTILIDVPYHFRDTADLARRKERPPG